MINLNGFGSLVDNRITTYRLNFIGGGAIIKPLPVWDVRRDSLTPCIEDIEFQQLGQWLVCYPTVTIPTIQGVCRFIPYDPYDIDSMYKSPAYKLYTAIAQAKASGIAPPTWNQLFMSSRERQDSMGRGLRGPTIELENYFMLGNVVASMDNKGVPASPITLVRLTKSAGINLKNAVLQNRNTTLLDVNDEVIHITPSAGGRQADGSMQPSQYLVKIVEQKDVSRRVGAIINMIQQERMSWDRIMRVLTPEEQLFVLLSSTIPPSAVVYALKEEFGDRMPAGYLATGERRLEEEMALPKSGMPQQFFPPQAPVQGFSGAPPQTPITFAPNMGLNTNYYQQQTGPMPPFPQQNPESSWAPQPSANQFPGGPQQVNLQNPFTGILQGGYGMQQPANPERSPEPPPAIENEKIQMFMNMYRNTKPDNK